MMNVMSAPLDPSAGTDDLFRGYALGSAYDEMFVRPGEPRRHYLPLYFPETGPSHQVEVVYLSGTLEVLSKGQVALTLPGVPEPEGFRHAVVNAVKAWVPGKATGPFQPASAVK